MAHPIFYGTAEFDDIVPHTNDFDIQNYKNITGEIRVGHKYYMIDPEDDEILFTLGTYVRSDSSPMNNTTDHIFTINNELVAVTDDDLYRFTNDIVSYLYKYNPMYKRVSNKKSKKRSSRRSSRRSKKRSSRRSVRRSASNA